MKIGLAKCSWTRCKRSFPAGTVVSPNHPNIYPNNIKRTEVIEVDEGLVISLEFTAFDIEYRGSCRWDHLTITDGDGTTLMGKSCGNVITYAIEIEDQPSIYSPLPFSITSRTNIVMLVFITDSSNDSGDYASASGPSGWSVNWRAVPKGEC